jgi:3alpha(or 20beta)-hydroxysteroid dehydrogenase
MSRLEGRIALITGAARGMGAATARLFAAEGARVVVTDVLDDLGKETAHAVDGEYLHLDVTAPGEWTAVAEAVEQTHGRLDVLVNNAGIASRPGPFEELDPEEHLRLFAVNVHGPFHGMRALLPLLGPGSSIVNISSIDGLVGVAGMASYVASKHALTGLTKSVALELGERGIRVNSIHPGVIGTPLVQGVGPERLARLERTVAKQPLARMGLPEEVARLSLFLASDDSAYCTGSQFTVDGGHLAGPWREPPA